MADQKPRLRYDGTPESIQTAHEIVREELGDTFYLEYGTMAKNVGIQGDQGVDGDTVLIGCEDEVALAAFRSKPDLMDHVASRLWNESFAVTRVLVDLTSHPRGTLEDF